MSYPTAIVQLQIGTWQQQPRVTVAPELLVAVLVLTICNLHWRVLASHLEVVPGEC